MDKSGQSTKFIFLPECRYVDLLAAIEMIYNGKVDLTVAQLPGFHRVLRMLQVKMDRQALSLTQTPIKANASRMSDAASPKNNDAIVADQSKRSIDENDLQNDQSGSFPAALTTFPMIKKVRRASPDLDTDDASFKAFKATNSSSPIKIMEDSIMPDDDIDESMDDVMQADPIK